MKLFYGVHRMWGLSFCLALGVRVASSDAPVQELWRTGLTNTFSTAYQTTTAAVDGAGNVILGGLVVSASGSLGEVLLAKFDAGGKKLWEYRTGQQSAGGVDALAVDAAGNIFAVTRPSTGDPWPLALIKLDPSGAESWRIVETNAAAHEVATGSSVATDAAGNAYFLGMAGTGVFVAKHTSDGQRVWRCWMPDAVYGFPLGGVWKCLAVGPDGSVAVGGFEVHSTLGRIGFVARINSDGTLRWFRNSFGGARIVGPVSSIASADDGAICAAGVEGFAVLSSEGDLLGARGRSEAGDVAGSLANGGFLLVQAGGYELTAINSTGTVRWRAFGGVGYGLGAASDGTGGWYVGGLYYSADPSEVMVLRYDSKGFCRLRCITPDYRYDSRGDRHTSSLLVAPDGTFRLVVNLRSSFFEPSPGVAVASFAVEGLTNLAQIVHSPEPVMWDGKSSVTFSLDVASSSDTTIQWRCFANPIIGATNEVLVIRPEDVPRYRGYVFAEVMNTNGVIATPIAELRLGRTLLAAPPPDPSGYWLHVISDLGLRFRVERSTNLLDWEPVEGWFAEFDYRVPAQIPDSGAVFYRAVELP